MIHSIGGFSGGAIIDNAGNAAGMLDSFETLKAGAATTTALGDSGGNDPSALSEPYACGMTPEAVATCCGQSTPSASVDVHTIKPKARKVRDQ